MKKRKIQFVKDQVCKCYQEDLRAEGKTTEDSCVLCQDENVNCRVGNHKTKDEKSSELFSLVSKLSSDFDKAKPILDKLSTDFDKAKHLFYKAGDTYELIARRELRELKGSEYAREFSCKDLHGLARLAFPKGCKLEGEKIKRCEHGEVSLEHQKRIDVLTNVAMQEGIPLLEKSASLKILMGK